MFPLTALKTLLCIWTTQTVFLYIFFLAFLNIKYSTKERFCDFWATNSSLIQNLDQLSDPNLNLLKFQVFQSRFQKVLLDTLENSNIVTPPFFALNYYQSYPLIYLNPSTSKQTSQKFFLFSSSNFYLFIWKCVVWRILFQTLCKTKFAVRKAILQIWRIVLVPMYFALSLEQKNVQVF